MRLVGIGGGGMPPSSIVCMSSWRTILGGWVSPAGCRERVSGALFFTPWYVDNFEAIPQGLLLEVPESGVADVVQRSVAEYLQEWLVVNRNGEVFASKDEMPRFV